MLGSVGQRPPEPPNQRGGIRTGALRMLSALWMLSVMCMPCALCSQDLLDFPFAPMPAAAHSLRLSDAGVCSAVYLWVQAVVAFLVRERKTKGTGSSGLRP